MPKVTLNNLASLQNDNTAVTTINTNNDAVEAAMENTLSRNGLAPNQMEAQLDMNSNRIINTADPLFGGDVINLDYLNSQIAGPLPTFSPGVPTDVLFYDTFVAAQSATVPGATNYIVLKGFYAVGDGGGARYYKVLAAPYQLTSADGAHWRILEDIMDIRMFGAKCDGVTNDAAAIVLADETAASLGGKVYLPGQGDTVGFILCNSPLTPSTNAHWFGEGDRTTLYMTSTSTTTFILNTSGVQLRDFRIVYSTGTPRLSTAITFDMQGCGDNLFENINILFAGVVFKINCPSTSNVIRKINVSASVANCVTFDVYDSLITNVLDCFCSESSAARPFSTILLRNCSGQMQVINCSFTQAVHGIVMLPGNGQSVTLFKSYLSYYDSCGTSLFQITPSGTGIVIRCEFNGGWFAGAGGFNIVGGGSTIVDELTFRAMDWILSPSATSVGTVADASNISFTDNNFFNVAGTAGLTFTNVNGGIIAQNRFLSPMTLPVSLTGTTDRTCVHDNVLFSSSGVSNSASGTKNQVHNQAGP